MVCTDLSLSVHFPGQTITAQDAYEPHAPKGRQTRDRGVDGCLESRTQGTRWTPLSPEGSFSHRVPFSSLGNLPSTSCHLSSDFNQARQQRAGTASEMTLTQNQTKTPAGVAVEQETNKEPVQGEIRAPAPAAKQFNSALLGQDRKDVDGDGWMGGWVDEEGHEECKFTTQPSRPTPGCPPERRSHRANRISFSHAVVTHCSQPSI